ncbi:hypothetical protein BJF91_11260 [Allorhizobium taibaishanense]|uniref:Uncharacterized protein n=1 Tax=Allorhizobium taibaishanense TaxID=887144 RepID=A0A1Q9A065_9HYPH|nr:hypothetical protein [Allorhizobium taibaishanense]OLP47985.1 hypothetical protein BJF91_11260 [Allorhizobium taibaishanense]
MSSVLIYEALLPSDGQSFGPATDCGASFYVAFMEADAMAANLHTALPVSVILKTKQKNRD